MVVNLAKLFFVNPQFHDARQQEPGEKIWTGQSSSFEKGESSMQASKWIQQQLVLDASKNK